MTMDRIKHKYQAFGNAASHQANRLGSLGGGAPTWRLASWGNPSAQLPPALALN